MSDQKDRLLQSRDDSELREAFVRRLTVDSPHRDRRRKDYNQAIFMPHGPAVWSSTDLDMVLRCFDDAVRDLGRTSLSTRQQIEAVRAAIEGRTSVNVSVILSALGEQE